MGRLKAFRRLVTLALLILLTGTAWAEVCKGSKLPRADPAKHAGATVEETVHNRAWVYAPCGKNTYFDKGAAMIISKQQEVTSSSRNLHRLCSKIRAFGMIGVLTLVAGLLVYCVTQMPSYAALSGLARLSPGCRRPSPSR